jgi:hypothetical protein
MTAPITAEELRDWQRLAPTLPLSDQMLRLIAAVEALAEMKRTRKAAMDATGDRTYALVAYLDAKARALALVE